MIDLGRLRSSLHISSFTQPQARQKAARKPIFRKFEGCYDLPRELGLLLSWPAKGERMNHDLDSSSSQNTAAQWPIAEALPEVRVLAAPHPALIDREELKGQCQFHAMRRGGPGGQHRNKVSSAVRLVHEPTGLIGEASERRDQSQNLSVAIERLRLRLAIQYRTAQSPVAETSSEQRKRWQGTNLKISDTNPDYAAILALLLDDLHLSGGQPSLVAELWQTSTSAIVRFISAVPAALELLNQWRAHFGRRPLKATQ